jgi:ribosomal protein S18 acetylase RimI-like enzyme
MKIENPTEEDSNEFYELYQHAARRKNQYGDRAWRDGFSREWAERALLEHTTFVARSRGKVVAALTLEWSEYIWADHDEQNAGYVHRLAVAEGSHGQEIGRKVIDWAADETKNRGRKFIRLDCPTANTSLTDYYLGIGFELVEIKEIPEYGAVVNMLQRVV